MSTLDYGRTLFWALMAFLAFGVMFFAAAISWIAVIAWRSRRRPERRFEVNPMRRLRR